MTQQKQPNPRELCPHLAAAVLWMSKNSRTTRRGGAKIRSAWTYGRAIDEVLAL